MPRKEFPARVKAEAFERARGRCEGCGERLAPNGFHYDHNVPDALGGLPTAENCVVLCIPCHNEKTRGRDVPAIAKSKRIRAKLDGTKKRKSRPIPGSKDSGWKKPLRGPARRR